jgi:hypothetical protein
MLSGQLRPFTIRAKFVGKGWSMLRSSSHRRGDIYGEGIDRGVGIFSNEFVLSRITKRGRGDGSFMRQYNYVVFKYLLPLLTPELLPEPTERG